MKIKQLCVLIATLALVIVPPAFADPASEDPYDCGLGSVIDALREAIPDITPVQIVEFIDQIRADTASIYNDENAPSAGTISKDLDFETILVHLPGLCAISYTCHGTCLMQKLNCNGHIHYEIVSCGTCFTP